MGRASATTKNVSGGMSPTTCDASDDSEMPPMTTRTSDDLRCQEMPHGIYRACILRMQRRGIEAAARYFKTVRVRIRTWFYVQMPCYRHVYSHILFHPVVTLR